MAKTLRSVARMGYGAMQIERLHGDRQAGLDLVRRARELGIDHFDTAEFYGGGFVNGVLREALAGDIAAGEVVIATKVGADPETNGPIPLRAAQKPDEIRASVHANLRSLGVDRLDVVNLRRLDVRPGVRAEGDQRVDVDDQLAVLTELRDDGLIAGIGISSVSLEILERALPAQIVCVQNAYSLLSREAEALLTLCERHEIAWVPFFPLGGAFPGVPKVTDNPTVIGVAERLGATPSQVGLAWLLRHSPETLLIPGTSTPAHLAENQASIDIELDDEAVAALDQAAAASTGPSAATATLGG